LPNHWVAGSFLLVQGLRDLSPTVCRFVKRHRTPLALFSTLNLALVIWQVLSGAQSTRENPRQLPESVALVSVLHDPAACPVPGTLAACCACYAWRIC